MCMLLLQHEIEKATLSKGCPRKNVPLGEGQTSSKGTFFWGHLVAS